MSETEVSDAFDPKDVVEVWNEVAVSLGKPKVRDLTPERRQLLKARMAQYELDDFVLVFNNIKSSPFLRGDHGWRGCTFDWVFKKANFQKILEGNYDNGKGNGPGYRGRERQTNREGHRSRCMAEPRCLEPGLG